MTSRSSRRAFSQSRRTALAPAVVNVLEHDVERTLRGTPGPFGLVQDEYPTLDAINPHERWDAVASRTGCVCFWNLRKSFRARKPRWPLHDHLRSFFRRQAPQRPPLDEPFNDGRVLEGERKVNRAAPFDTSVDIRHRWFDPKVPVKDRPRPRRVRPLLKRQRPWFLHPQQPGRHGTRRRQRQRKKHRRDQPTSSKLPH